MCWYIKQVVDVENGSLMSGTSPTHENASILDLILKNLEGFYELPVSLGPLAKSDHNILWWKPKSRNNKPKPKTVKIVYRPLSESSIQTFGRWIANFDFDPICVITNIDEKVETLYSILQQMYHEFFPIKERMISETDKSWLDTNIKKMIKERCKLHATGDILNANKIRNKVVSALRASRKRYVREKIAPFLNSDSNKWHDAIKWLSEKKKGNEIRINKTDGSLIKVSEVNEFFTQICTTLPTVSDEQMCDIISSNSSDEIVEVSEMAVYYAIG